MIRAHTSKEIRIHRAKEAQRMKAVNLERIHIRTYLERALDARLPAYPSELLDDLVEVSVCLIFEAENPIAPEVDEQKPSN